jgi:hypothetical protein
MTHSQTTLPPLKEIIFRFRLSVIVVSFQKKTTNDTINTIEHREGKNSRIHEENKMMNLEYRKEKITAQ